MANTQTFTTIINLNDQEARKNLDDLKKKVDNLKDARDKAISSKQSSAFIKDLNKQLKAAEAEVKSYETHVSKTIEVLNHLGDHSVGEIKKAMAELRKEQQATTNSDTYALLEDRIRKCDVRLNELAHDTKLVDDTMRNLSGSKLKDLEYTAKVLNKRLREVEKGTDEYKKLTTQLKEVKTAIKDINDETKEKEGFFEKTAKFFNTNWGAITQGLAAITGTTMTMRKAVDAYAQAEEAMANVRKYTGQSTEAVKAMNEEFKKLDTRTPREHLNELAGSAGRLGKQSTKDIMEFVDAADKISVALGDDLGKSAVDQIGKLAMAFGEDDKMGLRGAMLATGSAINELAQDSAANAGYLVEFTARVAGVGKQLGMSQADIMGFGAVLDENMQKDEMAATAFSQLLSKMAADTKTFAKMAGKPVEEFSKMVKEDANGAVLALMDNLRGQGGFETLGKMFGDMGLDGTRAVSVLTTIADKIQDVRKHQETANKAYEEGNSVIEEFNVQNSTVQAGLDKAKKAFNEITVELGEKLMPIARYGITTGSAAIKVLSNIVTFVTNNTSLIFGLAAAVAAYTLAVNRKLVLDKIDIALTTTKNVLTKAYTITIAVLTGKVSLATVAQHAWNAAVAAHPAVAFAVAIGAAVTAIAMFTRKVDENAEAQKTLNGIRKKAIEDIQEEKGKLERLRGVAKDTNRKIEDRIKAVNELNRIIPDYKAGIDAETGAYTESKIALDKYLESLQRKYELEGAEEELKRIGSEKALAKKELLEAEQRQKEEIERQQRNAENGSILDYNQPATMFNAEITRRADKAVEDAKERIRLLNKESELINDIYGEDLKNKTLEENGNSGNGNGGNGNNNGGGYKSEDELRKEEIERKKRLKAATDAVKAVADAENAANMEAYSQGLVSYREYLAKRQEIALNEQDEFIKVYGEDANEAKRCLETKERLQMKYSEKMNALNEEDIKRFHTSNAISLKEAYETADSEIYHNDEALQEALFENEMMMLYNRRDLYKRDSDEWQNLDAEITELDEQHKLELRQYYSDQLARYRERWARRDIATEEKITLEGLDGLHEKGLLKESEYQEMRREIILRYAQMNAEQDADNSKAATISRNADTAFKTASAKASADLGNKNDGKLTFGSFLMGDVDMYKGTVEQLRTMYEQDAINHEEYQQAKSMAFGNFTAGITSKMQAAYDAIAPIMNGMSSLWSAQAKYEESVTTKKYDKLIEAAGNNTKKTKKLEEKKQKELAEIKSKYNKKAMAMEMAQATATMILGAMNAYSSAFKGAPYPANLVLAPLAAGIATAAGLMNIAAIKKQHDAEAAGYFSGGFTGGKSYRQEAGVVHQGEFVANHQAVNNSHIFPALQLIDEAQRRNTVASLTAADITRAVGGSGQTVVSAPTVNVMTDNSEVVATVSAAREVIGNLTRLLANGIHASVTMDGDDGIVKAQKKWNLIQGNK